ncbi:MAG: hypothetical protein HQ557_12340 [Bacteroidetes bacterium]|nr:hypothetical protein [Bacteroidota bacterium]
MAKRLMSAAFVIDPYAFRTALIQEINYHRRRNRIAYLSHRKRAVKTLAAQGL